MMQEGSSAYGLATPAASLMLIFGGFLPQKSWGLAAGVLTEDWSGGQGETLIFPVVFLGGSGPARSAAPIILSLTTIVEVTGLW